ncbi:MAG: hypothetical protein V2G47_05070 [bacterium JZ-2024 1]
MKGPPNFPEDMDSRKIVFFLFLVFVFLLVFFFWSGLLQAGLFSSVQMAFQGKRVDAIEGLIHALPLLGNFLWTYIVLGMLVILFSLFVVIFLVFLYLLLFGGEGSRSAGFILFLVILFLLLLLLLVAVLFLVVPPLEFLFPVIVAERKGGLSALLRSFQIAFRSFSGGYLPAFAVAFFWILLGLFFGLLGFFAEFYKSTPVFLTYNIALFFLVAPIFNLFRATVSYALYTACAGAERVLEDDKMGEVTSI